MSRSLNRAEWTALCRDLQGEDGDFRVAARIAPGRCNSEFNDDTTGLVSNIDAYVTLGATDVRCGQVQLLVGKNRGALIVSHPPYPISRWTVLWEGEF